jgi:hypothetical protein
MWGKLWGMYWKYKSNARTPGNGFSIALGTPFPWNAPPFPALL